MTRVKLDVGLIRHLKDQLKVKLRVDQIKKSPRLLRELAFYPPHDKRIETAQYKAVHKKMVVEMDLPCLVCGVRNSVLKDKKKNPYGAKQLETHHHIVEWALSNAISAERFNKTLLPNLRHKHPNKAEYKKEFSDQQVHDWVDHSEDNLWVLCDVHHRAKYLGIHEITYPIWAPQDLLRDDFEEYVKTQIAEAKSDANSKKSNKQNTKV